MITCQCGHAANNHNQTGCLQYIASIGEVCPCKLTPSEITVYNDTVVNAQGGKQSRLDMDFTEIEPIMLQRVARVLKQGKDKYGSKNWRNIPYEDHINHMQYHAIMANSNDQSEDHLANTICRAMFAMYMKQVPPIVGGHVLNTGWSGPTLSPWDTNPRLHQEMYNRMRAALMVLGDEKNSRINDLVGDIIKLAQESPW